MSFSVGFGLITGAMVGIEFCGDDNGNYVVFDLLIFRVIAGFFFEDQ